MNEKLFKVIFIFITAALFTATLFCAIISRPNLDANGAAGTYRERLERCETKLNICREQVAGIAEQLDRNEQSIHGVVLSLREIAARVKVLEDCLYDVDRSDIRFADVQLAESLEDIYGREQ